MQSDFDSRFAFSTLANVFIELPASNGSNYTFFIKEIKKKIANELINQFAPMSSFTL
jgi:hypothetical protein